MDSGHLSNKSEKIPINRNLSITALPDICESKNELGTELST